MAPRGQFNKHFTAVTYCRSKVSSMEALTLHGSIHAAAAVKCFSVSVTYSCKFVYGIGSKVCHLREHFAENFFFSFDECNQHKA